MAPLVGTVVGLALLLFGRRLYWVFVAGIGFLTGLEFAPEILPGQPDWVILVAALVAALVGALLAVMAQAFVIGAIGFVAGGGVALRFIRALGVAAETPTWMIVFIGGIVGVVLMLWLFNWALIVLSSLAGASLVVAGLAPRLSLAHGPAFFLVIAVAIAGIIFQIGIAGDWPRRAPPASRA
jgi:hypothetical protein